jgi:hypothetical protein
MYRIGQENDQYNTMLTTEATVCDLFIQAVDISYIQPIIFVLSPLLLSFPHAITLSPLQNFSTIALADEKFNPYLSSISGLDWTNLDHNVIVASLICSIFSILIHLALLFFKPSSAACSTLYQLPLSYFIYFFSNSFQLAIFYSLFALLFPSLLYVLHLKASS